MTEIERLTMELVAFRDARDWAQFHNPKDLSLALGIEVAELQELLLWKKPDQIEALCSTHRQQLADELADVAAYLMLLSHELRIPLAAALEAKIAKNALKYPVDKVRGDARKYDAY